MWTLHNTKFHTNMTSWKEFNVFAEDETRFLYPYHRRDFEIPSVSPRFECFVACMSCWCACVCLCVCTKFQLLNECNGILFQCIVVGLLWVFCSELNSMELGPLVLFCHFSMLQKHPFSIVFNHTHTTFIRFYFASFLKRCRSLSVCVLFFYTKCCLYFCTSFAS